MDICERKHGGNEQSAAAFEALNLNNLQAEVLDAIQSAGQRGMTCHELADQWGVGVNQISGRFSELKAKGLAAVVGTRRNEAGRLCGVLVATV